MAAVHDLLAELSAGSIGDRSVASHQRVELLRREARALNITDDAAGGGQHDRADMTSW